MAVISISISESSEQLVAGFPKSISLSTNIPATIFYTIDGSIPDTFSSVYVDPIILPTNILEFILKIYATNGSDSSPIITHTYSTNILNNTRLPHANVADISVNNNQYSLYPYGSNEVSQNFDYTNNANSNNILNSSNTTTIPYGFDASGNTVGTKEPVDDYLNVYSQSKDKKFSYIPGVFPGEVTVIGRRNPSAYSVEESNRSSRIFDPRAMVIFQDINNDDPTSPPQINPQHFSMEHIETGKGDAKLRAVSLDSPNVSGSYLKSYYNPRTQMITAYYRDSITNRWLISSYPYTQSSNNTSNLSSMVFGRDTGTVGRVFGWYFGKYRTLT